MIGRRRPAGGEPPAETTLNLPNNPALAASLEAIKAKGRADQSDVDAVKKATGKLSLEEAEAIRQTFRGLSRISHDTRNQIDDFLWNGLKARAEHIEKSKKHGDVLNAFLLGTTAVGVPLLNQMLGIANLEFGANLAANAVQVGILAGEYLGGYAAIRFIKDKVSGGEPEYGERD